MAKQFTLILIDRERNNVADVPISAEKMGEIAEASVVVYQGKYYAYSRVGAPQQWPNIALSATFMEVNPPVELS